MSSESSSAATQTESPALRVSLAGSQHESMTAALDQAMAKLSAVTQTDGPGGDVSPNTSTALFQLIEAMSSAPSRRDAAVALVGFLASQCNDCSVRCGFGRGRLTHLFDHRLGWLGPESSLQQGVAEQWESPRRRASDPQSDDPQSDAAAVLCRDRVVELQLPQPGGSSKCVVWIEGQQVESDPLAWLPPIVTTIGTVLWSRPVRSWPSIIVRMARHTSITVAVAGLLLLVLAIWPVHYRVACTARVETTQQRLISTPFEATLLKANVKPGDTVKSGDVLLVLDGRPLRLEREAIESEIQQVAKEHDVALATRRIADAQQAAFKRQQLNRHYDLLSDRLGRLEVISPIDGVVVSGDLEKFVGSPLERGQTLIEVAPMDKMIVEVEIPEYEIGYISKDAETRLKIDAIGGKSIRTRLTDVYPSAELRDDRNVFIGRIVLENTDQKLKPGMRGEATAYGPLRPWIWSWVRGSIEQVLWWIGY